MPRLTKSSLSRKSLALFVVIVGGDQVLDAFVASMSIKYCTKLQLLPDSSQHQSRHVCSELSWCHIIIMDWGEWTIANINTGVNRHCS